VGHNDAERNRVEFDHQHKKKRDAPDARNEV
jgi:hypothetical protein